MEAFNEIEIKEEKLSIPKCEKLNTDIIISQKQKQHQQLPQPPVVSIPIILEKRSPTPIEHIQPPAPCVKIPTNLIRPILTSRPISRTAALFAAAKPSGIATQPLNICAPLSPTSLAPAAGSNSPLLLSPLPSNDILISDTILNQSQSKTVCGSGDDCELSQQEPQQLQRSTSVCSKLGDASRPQPVTSKLFAPRTKEMNKGFLMYSEEEPGLISEYHFSI